MYKIKEEILKIDWLSTKDKEKTYSFVENLKEKKDKEMYLCEKGEKDCDESFKIIEEIENKGKLELSMFKIANEVRKKLNKNENEVCDITRIYVSEKIYNETVEYDTRIFKTLFSDRYTSVQAKKEISKIHLMYGIGMSTEIKDNKVHILEGVFKS